MENEPRLILPYQEFQYIKIPTDYHELVDKAARLADPGFIKGESFLRRLTNLTLERAPAEDVVPFADAGRSFFRRSLTRFTEFDGKSYMPMPFKEALDEAKIFGIPYVLIDNAKFDEYHTGPMSSGEILTVEFDFRF